MSVTRIYSADLLWRWENVLDEELKNKLSVAVQANWAYARLSAWSYLRDETLAVEMMEKAIEAVRSYALRSTSPPSTKKLSARLHSQIRRIAKQGAHRLQRENLAGSLHDIEIYAPTINPDPTDLLLLKQIFSLLSPQAQDIWTWLWMGYSWREIGKSFQIDHSVVRMSFRREVDAALAHLGNTRKSV
jgi:hypothetical protein